MASTSFVYHFSKSTFLSEFLKIFSAVRANGPKFSTYGRIPHLCLLLTLVSRRMDCNCACMNLSKARLTWTRAEAKVIERKEPVSWADITCWDKRTRTYMHQLKYGITNLNRVSVVKRKIQDSARTNCQSYRETIWNYSILAREMERSLPSLLELLRLFVSPVFYSLSTLPSQGSWLRCLHCPVRRSPYSVKNFMGSNQLFEFPFTKNWILRSNSWILSGFCEPRTFEGVKTTSSCKNATQNACSARHTGWSCERARSSNESNNAPSPWGAQVSPLSRHNGAGAIKSSPFWLLDFDEFAGQEKRIVNFRRWFFLTK